MKLYLVKTLFYLYYSTATGIATSWRLLNYCIYIFIYSFIIYNLRNLIYYIFCSNTGGGVHFSLNIVNVSISKTIFLDNFASISGAGLLAEENIRDMYITDCNFTNNYVFGFGGSVYFGKFRLF